RAASVAGVLALRVASVAFGLLACSSGCVIDELREDDVGDAPACDAASRWPHDWGSREDALIEAINDARAAGGMCGDRSLNPAPDLTLAPELRCASRRHAVDQAYAGTLDHEGTDDSTTLSRVDLAQYPGVPSFELLAGDFLDPEAVVEAWLDSPAECLGLLDGSAEELGVGFARSQDGSTTAWVLLIGELRD
ncbi:MAG: CAP domain-containing protein, partial [Myxococcota bacterium]